jgi:hypothetical protein
MVCLVPRGPVHGRIPLWAPLSLEPSPSASIYRMRPIVRGFVALVPVQRTMLGRGRRSPASITCRLLWNGSGHSSPSDSEMARAMKSSVAESLRCPSTAGANNEWQTLDRRLLQGSTAIASATAADTASGNALNTRHITTRRWSGYLYSPCQTTMSRKS